MSSGFLEGGLTEIWLSLEESPRFKVILVLGVAVVPCGYDAITPGTR